ncbi:MAG TPA: response regulator [Flavitalea sp.]|nr:response regulator [Flavitalea sp.]
MVHKKALIVDDDARNIFALKAVLKARGYHCLSASSMSEAFDMLLSADDVGVVLMDMMMPEMDGYEGIAKIGEAGIKVPVIAITAQAMPGDREKCLEAGAEDYISKPVDIDKLEPLLKAYLK